MHELVGHLIKGAAALAARHWVKKRSEKKKEKAKEKSSRSARDEYTTAAAAEPSRRHRDRHRHRDQPNEYREVPRQKSRQPELVVALDGLSAELARTTSQIRQLAGRRRPHRHRDGRCEVYEGLVSCASRLEAEAEGVRTGVNNIRNLGLSSVEGLGTPSRRARSGRSSGRREWVFGGESEIRRDGRRERRRDGAGYTTVSGWPEESKRGGRRVRISEEESRGRRRTR